MLDFLKTMPDMTTQEITMTPKKPMTKRIRAYKAEHPNATHREIAKALDTTSKYVSLTLTTLAKPKDQASEKPVSNKELNALKEEIETQRIVIDALKRTVEKNLAVIEYLEGKIDDLGGLVC